MDLHITVHINNIQLLQKPKVGSKPRCCVQSSAQSSVQGSVSKKSHSFCGLGTRNIGTPLILVKCLRPKYLSAAIKKSVPSLFALFTAVKNPLLKDLCKTSQTNFAA